MSTSRKTAPGVAEDGRVVMALGKRAGTPFATFGDCFRPKNSRRLEPGDTGTQILRPGNRFREVAGGERRQRGLATGLRPAGTGSIRRRDRQPLLPLIPGTTYIYRGVDEDGTSVRDRVSRHRRDQGDHRRDHHRRPRPRIRRTASWSKTRWITSPRTRPATSGTSAKTARTSKTARSSSAPKDPGGRSERRQARASSCAPARSRRSIQAGRRRSDVAEDEAAVLALSAAVRTPHSATV